MSNLVQLIIQFRNCLPMGENRGNQTGGFLVPLLLSCLTNQLDLSATIM